MKKFILAVALLLVVVGAAYIKSTRGTGRQRQAFESGRIKSRQELTALQRDVDSLKRLLELEREAYADSLAIRDGALRHEISVLVGFLDSAIGLPEPPQDSAGPIVEEAAPESKPPAKESKDDTPPTVAQKGSPKPPAESVPAKPTGNKQDDSESESDKLKEKVLTYYGKLYESLPNDLTSDERKVALYEISLKTAAEFSITMPQLKEIYEDYYLRY